MNQENNYKLEKINNEIKATWRKMFRSLFLLIIVVALGFYLFDLKEKKYNDELESTTWYEVEAKFSHSNQYSETETTEDGYEYVDYYDWYFTYVGRDGKTYNYVDKKQLFEPDENYTTTIYVDENDYSHSLKIESNEYNGLAKKIVIIIIVFPYIITYLITFTILYIRKTIIKNKIKKEL